MEVIDDLLKICEQGNLHRFHAFIENNDVDVNICTLEENTPLQVAAANGHNDIIKFLLSHGTDVNQTNMYGWTPLMQACRHGHTATVSLLLREGASAIVVNKMGATALICAVRSGHLSTVRTLIESDNDFLASESQKMNLTATMVAAQLGHDPILRFLLEIGFDVNRSSHDTGLTALMLAANVGHWRTAKILVDRNASVTATTKCGKTALDFAIVRGRRQVRCYLEQKMAEDKSNERVGGDHDIMSAIQSGDVECAKSILAYDAKLVNRARLDDGATPIMLASHCGNLSVVQTLVENGAEINRQNTVNGCTALVEALLGGNNQVALYLIQAGADVNIRTNSGSTAFDVASVVGSVDSELLAILGKKTKPELLHPLASVIWDDHLLKKKSFKFKKLVWDKLPFKATTSSKLIPQWMQGKAHCKLQNLLAMSTIGVDSVPKQNVATYLNPFLVDQFSSSPCRVTVRKNPVHPVPPLLPSLSLDSSNASLIRVVASKQHRSSLANPSPKKVLPNSLKSDELIRINSFELNLGTLSVAKVAVGSAAEVLDRRSTKKSDLAFMFKKFSLEKYKPVFDEHEVDVEALMLLCEQDLCDLGVNDVQDRKLLLDIITQLNNNASCP